MEYTKKPVVIEAVQLTWALVTGNEKLPEWFKTALAEKTIRITLTKKIENSQSAIISTLEGEMQASANDYIIRDIKGELYPCKPDIFEATYDAGDQTKSDPAISTPEPRDPNEPLPDSFYDDLQEKLEILRKEIGLPISIIPNYDGPRIFVDIRDKAGNVLNQYAALKLRAIIKQLK